MKKGMETLFFINLLLTLILCSRRFTQCMYRNTLKNEARLLTQVKVRTYLRTRDLSQDLSSNKSYSQTYTIFLNETMNQLQQEIQATVGCLRTHLLFWKPLLSWVLMLRLSKLSRFYAFYLTLPQMQSQGFLYTCASTSLFWQWRKTPEPFSQFKACRKGRRNLHSITVFRYIHDFYAMTA